MRGVMVAMVVGGALALPVGAAAQIMAPPVPSLVMPPPPAPPPPRIEVPVVPQFDAPPSQVQAVQPARHRSFSRRVTKCLDEGAAAGLDSSERAAYSRACANQ
jgi:hypothetical protein